MKLFVRTSFTSHELILGLYWDSNIVEGCRIRAVFLLLVYIISNAISDILFKVSDPVDQLFYPLIDLIIMLFHHS